MWACGGLGNAISIGDRKERMRTEDRPTGGCSLGEKQDSSERVAGLGALLVSSEAQGTALCHHCPLFGPTATFRRTSEGRIGFQGLGKSTGTEAPLGSLMLCCPGDSLLPTGHKFLPDRSEQCFHVCC